MDKLTEARQKGTSWTNATAFDYSLAIGEWCDKEAFDGSGLVIDCAHAIEEVSRLMTIRQGDLIYIDSTASRQRVENEEVIEGPEWAKYKLYCKIK